MDERANYGNPDLEIHGLQLWVHGREFPASHDYYDGNWLLVTVHFCASGFDVRDQGALVLVTEILEFGEQCEQLLSGSRDVATLAAIEPGIPQVYLQRADSAGHFSAVGKITPNHMRPTDYLEFTADRDYVHQLITQCQSIVKVYQVRGSKPTAK